MTNAREGWLDKAGIEHMQRMLEHHDPKNTHTLCRMALSALEQEADYAALKARVEELDHDRIIREAYEAEFGKLDELRERIAKTTDAKHLAQLVTNKARDYAKDERDSLRAEVMEQARLLGISGSREASLRAQLEAAKGQAEVAENNFKQAAALLDSYQNAEAQLTAQPDGVRSEALKQLQRLRNWHFAGQFVQPAMERQILDNVEAALSAAPAREDGVLNLQAAYAKVQEAHLQAEIAEQALAAPASPAPDECMACIGEKWGMPPGGTEPHTCEKAPAPAKVCQTCGGKGRIQNIHIFEAGGHTEVTEEAPTPCPDCAHEEGKHNG